jgi:hypothetical protein
VNRDQTSRAMFSKTTDGSNGFFLPARPGNINRARPSLFELPNVATAVFRPRARKNSALMGWWNVTIIESGLLGFIFDRALCQPSQRFFYWMMTRIF